MPGLGTLFNVGGIVIGGLLGLLFGRFLKENVQRLVMIAIGSSTIFIGVAGTLAQMLKLEPDGTLTTTGSMMLIASLVIGGIIGELLKIEYRIEQFGAWLKIRTRNTGDPQFIEAFVLSTLVVAVGAMAVIGSIRDGLFGDYSILALKSLIDLVSIMIMTSVMGKGCIFSAIPVGILEGGMTILARLLEPLLTAAAMSNLSLVGNVLICMVGVNIIRPRSVPVSNLLPSIVIAVGCAFLPWL